MQDIRTALKKNNTINQFDSYIMTAAGEGRRATINDAFALIIAAGARKSDDDKTTFIPLLDELLPLVKDAATRNATKYGTCEADDKFVDELIRVIRKNINAFAPVLRDSELEALEAVDVASSTELRNVASLYTGEKKSRAAFRKAAKNPRIFRAITKSTQALICDAAKNAYDAFGADLFAIAKAALKREAERLDAIATAQAADNE